LFGFAFFIFARVGYAKPVPISTANFKHRKTGVITVSISGIVLNLLTSFLFVPIFLLFAYFVYPLMESNFSLAIFGKFIYYFLLYTVVIGINLALFNLLPLYPLDGYHFLEGLVNPSNKIMRFLRDFGWLIIMGVVLYSIIVNRIGLPAYYDPLYWYLNVVGGYIRRFFALIWAPLFA
jgi:Zn-dependent protease